MVVAQLDISWMPNLEIFPYVGVGPLRFGMSKNEVQRLLGTPVLERFNGEGEIDMRYEGLHLGFDGTGDHLLELALSPGRGVSLSTIDIFFDLHSVAKLASIDGDPREGLGFIVFPNIGIALADFFSENERDHAVIAFARGRWDDLLATFARTDVGSVARLNTVRDS